MGIEEQSYYAGQKWQTVLDDTIEVIWKAEGISICDIGWALILAQNLEVDNNI